MKSTSFRRAIVPTVAVLALALTACGGQDVDGNSAGTSGTVVVDGSSTVEPMSAAAAELLVATDALTIVAHKDLAVDCLTTDQVIKLWEPGSKVTNWKQLDPSFPDVKISLFGPGTDSGTYDYLAADVIGHESEQTRDDYEASEDDNVLVQGVSGTKGATGYFGFTYYEQNADVLKALKIDDGKGCVEPSVESAQAGEYTPLARPLFIYVSNKSYTDSAAAKEYVDFYIANLARIAEAAQFIPLSEELYGETKSALDGISG